MRLLVSREAAREIRDARHWWREHRPGAPGAVSQELRRAFGFLRFSPRAGSLVAHAQLGGVRRIHLARIRYDLYYRVREDGSAVEVLALWHTVAREPGDRAVALRRALAVTQDRQEKARRAGRC